MPNNPKLTNLLANTMADAACTLLNGGFLDIYDGAQPANANTAVTTQVKLARLTFGSPAFGAAVNGVATANAITDDSAADATGTAAWFRARKSDGTTDVIDGTVGTSGCDLILVSVGIVAGLPVSVSTLTFTQPKG